MSLHCVPACIVPEMLAVFLNFSLLNYVTSFTLVAFKMFCDLPEFEFMHLCDLGDRCCVCVSNYPPCSPRFLNLWFQGPLQQ